VPGRLRREIQQTKPFPTLEEEVFVGLQRTATLFLIGLSEALTKAGVSPAQYNVLRILRGAGREGLACGAIWERMVTRDPDMTRLLDRLEARGLVTRARGQRDRRVVTASVTARGLRLLSGLDRPVTRSHRRTLGHMSRSALRSLATLLEQARTPGTLRRRRRRRSE
jgi:DNA-binding MarR family transcriptional regulator